MNRPHKRSLVTSPLLDSKDLRLPIHTSTPVSVHGNEPQIGTWAVGVNEEIEGLPHEEKDPSIPPSKRIRRGSSEVSTTAPIALSTDPKDRMLPTFGPLDPLGPLYTHGTQYRFWRFSSGQIIELRRQTHETAVQESLEVLREHPESWTKDDFLTPDEEYELIQHFMEQSALVCRKFKLNDLVRATALMCMRRFYLKKSVLFYDPKTVMLTCLFLASKVENSLIKLDDLVQGVKALNKMELKELEFVISETLQFQFWIRHPFEASFGIFLDCQETMETVDLALLWDTWKRAGHWICTSMFTDTGLRFMPSQVAMACWQLASQRSLFPFHAYLSSKHLKHPTTFNDVPTLQRLLDSIVQLLHSHTPVQKDRAMEIMKKLDRVRVAKAWLVSNLKDEKGGGEELLTEED